MSTERPFLKKDFAGLVDETLASLRSGAGGRVILDDATEGGVLRTLVEAFSREMAVCYEQLERVYQAGYLDTASGVALDRIVELLGVERHQAGWLEGDVLFARATPAESDIQIPAGTLVAGKNTQGFETLVQATLKAGEREVRVPVRSLVPEGEPVEADKLSILNRPIAGIERVTNPGLLLPRRDAETDEDLRTRARHAIRGGSTATLSALERAVMALGIIEVQISEDPEQPGWVQVLLGDEDLTGSEVEQVRREVEEIRPAGVSVAVDRAIAIWIRVRALVQLEQDLSPQAQDALLTRIGSQLAEHFARLRVNETVRWHKIRNLMASDVEVADVEPPRAGRPLLAVDGVTGAPLEETDVLKRQLGDEADPIGVFIGVGERARLSPGLEIELLPPELPAWIDVEAQLLHGAKKEDAMSAITEKLAQKLAELRRPDEPVASTILSFDELTEALVGLEGVDEASYRFLVLHGRDGRVVTLAPDASAEARIDVRERIVIRNVSLRPAPEQGAG